MSAILRSAKSGDLVDATATNEESPVTVHRPLVATVPRGNAYRSAPRNKNWRQAPAHAPSLRVKQTPTIDRPLQTGGQSFPAPGTFSPQPTVTIPDPSAGNPSAPPMPPANGSARLGTGPEYVRFNVRQHCRTSYRTLVPKPEPPGDSRSPTHPHRWPRGRGDCHAIRRDQQRVPAVEIPRKREQYILNRRGCNNLLGSNYFDSRVSSCRKP